MTVPVLMLDSKKKAALDAGFYETFTGLPERYFSAQAERKLAETILTTRGAAFWQAL